MANENNCPQCGSQLPSDSPQGLCPQCLMKLGLASTTDPQSAVPTTPNAPTPFVPPQPEELARKFPQLEIIELLGQGGMGAVYKARQKHLDRLVALKILPPQIGQDPTFAERFTREARSLARLNHPQIVTVFEFGHTDDGLYYFVMEYVDGTDLRQVIKAGQFSPKEALAIVPQICEALQFAHEEGIVHRDIKPENILIDKRGRIKIADFGLARLLDQPAKAYTLTQAGQRMGTPHYMAPEQIERPTEVDHRADIYSLGVVFYEMLTGELPIGRFDPPSRKVQVDVRLDEIVLHTLEKEPQRRYQHASEIKTDVETVSASSPAPPLPQQYDRQQRPSSMEGHIAVVAVLNIILGFIRLFLGAVLFTIIAGVGLVSGDFMAMQVTGIVGAIIAMTTGLTGIPTIIGGFGLRKRKSWARILMIVLSILDLATIPLGMLAGPYSLWKMLGVALSAYTLWVLFNKETVRLFQVASAPNGTPPTPHSPQSPFPTTASPAQPSPPAAHARPSPGTANIDTQEKARRHLRVPAIGLMIAGILSCFAVPIVIGGVIIMQMVAVPEPLAAVHPVRLGIGLPGAIKILILISSLVVGLIVTIGASRMLRMRSYGFAVATAILALLPCYPGFPIGLPFGIWALIVLNSLETQAAFAKQKQHPARTRTSPAITLLVCLAVALVVLGCIMLFTPAGWRPLDSGPTLAGRPLSFDLKLASEKIGEFDFPAGRTDHLTYKLDGPILSDRGVSAMNLTAEQVTKANAILETAYAEYVELERKNSSFSTSANSLSAVVSPFRQEAIDFLEKFWRQIDAVIDQPQRDLIHRHLPLGRIFGTFGFGKQKATVNISKKGNRFSYSVSWHQIEGPGPMGQLATKSSDSTRTLPFELHRFWNHVFGTTASTLYEEVSEKEAN